MKDIITNVLAERYASAGMKAIWSARGRVVLERELWIAVMKAQQELGLAIPGEAIAAYEQVKTTVDLESIDKRERITRHDVKARIEAFCELAGHEHIHKGMTSRDLTENVEQLQVFRALQHVRLKSVAALQKMGEVARAYKALPMAGRTHNVAAQLTTWGKRIAMFGEDFIRGFRGLEQVIATYQVRGLKGAVGTQLDQLNLFAGDAVKVAELESLVVKHLGIGGCFHVVGQVYPRSVDFEVLSALYQLSSGPSSFAKTLRLMAGHELASEGFAKGQVGSSAMPHKMNSRSCERLNGLQVILRGYLTMAEGVAGDQWNEGDVSCSVVRRVYLPDSFYAIDGLLETLLTILGQMETNQAVIQQEVAHYLPFLLTTAVLMEAVKAGVGRETAHEVIKEHAVAAACDLRAGSITHNDLFKRLACDARLGLSQQQLTGILQQGAEETGAAVEQVSFFGRQVDAIVEQYPAASAIEAEPML